MIECHPLIDAKRRRELVFELLDLKPLNALESDLMEKECLGGFQLIAKDEYGIFGTALLSKRRLVDFPGQLGVEGSFLENDYFFELSLVYADVPPQFEATLSDNPELMTHYTKRFYKELFTFLSHFTDHKALIVTTTLAEQELMLKGGGWHFNDSVIHKNHFIGILQLLPQKKSKWHELDPLNWHNDLCLH